MERFEIALVIDDTKILIPSMLPSDRPEDLVATVQKKYINATDKSKPGSNQENKLSGFLTRSYHMNYIPSGFLSRLIGEFWLRVIIAP